MYLSQPELSVYEIRGVILSKFFAEVVTKFTELYGTAPSVCAWAPGRYELSHNHGDYLAMQVCGAPKLWGTSVLLSPRDDGQFVITSASEAQAYRGAFAGNKIEEAELDWGELPFWVPPAIRRLEPNCPKWCKHLCQR